MKALVYGSTGLIGNILLSILIESSEFQEVTVFNRTPVSLIPEKVTQIVDHFENIDQYQHQLKADHIFYCLGTTRKKTPDPGIYYKIDHDYPLKAAEIGVANGSLYFHFISSIGADAKSRFLYTRIKGEVEQAIQILPFDGIYIYRPSLLVGSRKEHRFVENIASTIMSFINPLLIGPLKNYQSIKAEKVAQFIFSRAMLSEKGLHIYSSNEIKKLS